MQTDNHRCGAGPGRHPWFVAFKGGEESQLIERVMIQKEMVVRAGEETDLRGDE